MMVKSSVSQVGWLWELARGFGVFGVSGKCTYERKKERNGMYEFKIWELCGTFVV